jgi:hypothetical protein
MHYECEHGRRVIPRRGAAEAYEPCDECPDRRSDVRYGPIWAAGEGDNLETQLKATLTHALSHSRPFDWSE